MSRYSDEIKLAGIVRESITDGPGIRFTIFCQGCPHMCQGCHNEETWNFEGGKSSNIKDIFLAIEENPLISGVTFSGGEPVCQAEAFSNLAAMLKEKKINIVLFTGYTYEELMEMKDDIHISNLLSKVDILIDGKYVKEKRDLTLKFRGSSNQRIIDMNKSRESDHLVLANNYMV